MRNIVSTIGRLREADVNVLLLGENGTGKDVVARYLLSHSSRAAEPFVTIDVGAVPETLFESELFGYEKGAFTDARKEKRTAGTGPRGYALPRRSGQPLPPPPKVSCSRPWRKGAS